MADGWVRHELWHALGELVENTREWNAVIHILRYLEKASRAGTGQLLIANRTGIGKRHLRAQGVTNYWNHGFTSPVEASFKFEVCIAVDLVWWQSTIYRLSPVCCRRGGIRHFTVISWRAIYPSIGFPDPKNIPQGHTATTLLWWEEQSVCAPFQMDSSTCYRRIMWNQRHQQSQCRSVYMQWS